MLKRYAQIYWISFAPNLYPQCPFLNITYCAASEAPLHAQKLVSYYCLQVLTFIVWDHFHSAEDDSYSNTVIDFMQVVVAYNPLARARTEYVRLVVSPIFAEDKCQWVFFMNLQTLNQSIRVFIFSLFHLCIKSRRKSLYLLHVLVGFII